MTKEAIEHQNQHLIEASSGSYSKFMLWMACPLAPATPEGQGRCLSPSRKDLMRGRR